MQCKYSKKEAQSAKKLSLRMIFNKQLVFGFACMHVTSIDNELTSLFRNKR